MVRRRVIAVIFTTICLLVSPGIGKSQDDAEPDVNHVACVRFRPDVLEPPGKKICNKQANDITVLFSGRGVGGFERFFQRMPGLSIPLGEPFRSGPDRHGFRVTWDPEAGELTGFEWNDGSTEEIPAVSNGFTFIGSLQFAAWSRDGVNFELIPFPPGATVLEFELVPATI